MAMFTICVAWLLAQPALAKPRAVRSFTVYSDPIHLHRGEVHNAYVEPKALPEDFVHRFANKTVHIRSMQLDIVRLDAVTGTETALPLYETYNHHHALLLGPAGDLEKVYNYTKGIDPLNPQGRPRPHSHGCAMKGSTIQELLEKVAREKGRGHIASFGGASGAEFRGTPTRLPEPYTYAVSSPESFMILMHFINTRDVPHEQKLWECPCTKARKINVTNGTIDGMRPLPFDCSEELLREHNTACSLETYQGGYRCCEHGVFLLDERPDPAVPADMIQAKFTFEYYDETGPSAAGLRPTTQPKCCDATAGSSMTKRRKFANIEYDVPQCAPGTRPEHCEHVISSVEFFDLSNSSHHGGPMPDPDEELELVHAWGHQHVGALGLELIRESTGEVLCHSRPMYGSGSRPGDEAGFLVGIPPCLWGPPPLAPPPRLRRGELVRTVARYNSSEQHHGVMSLWLMQAAPVREPRAAVFV
mmetsp:Transcript_28369/g.58910  ORF Transcript_28369/g.58910 Transcript_28369/m.58910 type:complete len:474 (+) Transcript_28369:32-1453(+)